MSRRQYRITLEDGSVHYTMPTDRAPTFAASVHYEERQTRRVKGGSRWEGFGYLIETDPTKPPLKKQFVCLYEMRRHAKAACDNERWAVANIHPRFRYSDPRERRVLKVTDAQIIAKRPKGTSATRLTTRKDAEMYQEVRGGKR